MNNPTHRADPSPDQRGDRRPTLALFTCTQDVLITRLLLQRIQRLGAWGRFGRVFLFLDQDLTEEEANTFFRPLIPVPDACLNIFRSPDFDAWSKNRAAVALARYKLVSGLGEDFVRLDTDLFLRSPEFFERLLVPRPGIAGKLMPFFLPIQLGGKQLHFIQGGASYFGAAAREFLLNLRVEQLERLRCDWRAHVSGIDEERAELYEQFFHRTEDMVLTGLIASIHGLPVHAIPDLQLSPYDVLPGYKAPGRSPEEYLNAFRRSPALAFHYEGGHDGRKSLMTKMLKWCYEHWERLDDSGHAPVPQNPTVRTQAGDIGGANA